MKKSCMIVALLLTLVLPAAAGGSPVLANDSDKPLVYGENFDALADDQAAVKELEEDWSITGPLTLESEETGKSLKLSWWDLESRQMILDKVYVPNQYEMTFQIKGGTGSHDGCFVFLRTTAKPEFFPLFDSDGCASDGLANGVGDAGIYLKPHGTKLHIGVKTAETVSEIYTKGIGNLRYVVDLPEGKDFGFHYLNIKLVDQDNTVSVYLEDALAATISYSEWNGRYYTKAIIRDAGGEQVAQTSTARIAALENTPALVVRGGYMNLDNLSICSLTGSAPVLMPETALYDTTTGRGDPAAVTGETELAMKITVKNGQALRALTFQEMPTYDGLQTRFTFSVYSWNKDYATTLQGKALYKTEKYDHTNCTDCVFAFPEPLRAGTYLFVLSDGQPGVNQSGEPTGHPGVWTAARKAEQSVITFENGEEKAYSIYASISLLSGYPTEPNVNTGDTGLLFLLCGWILVSASVLLSRRKQKYI